MPNERIQGPTLRERLFSSRKALLERADTAISETVAKGLTPAKMAVARLRARAGEQQELFDLADVILDRVDAGVAREKAYKKAAQAPRIFRLFVSNK